ALVVAVEKELDKLDETKNTAWRKSIVEPDVPASASENSSVPETPFEPRVDASEVEATWSAPTSAAAGEDVRGYDVSEPPVEQFVPASTKQGPESTGVPATGPSHHNLDTLSNSIPHVEAADPAPKEEVEMPRPAGESSADDLRDRAPEALGQVWIPTVQGHSTDPDSESEDESVEQTEEQRHSDLGVEPFLDVQQASPVVSEASLGEFDDTTSADEATKDPLKDARASDEEFEIL
ncbi:hypothetical protein FRC01_003557, partial [Tulasnella sp. 417]